MRKKTNKAKKKKKNTKEKKQKKTGGIKMSTTRHPLRKINSQRQQQQQKKTQVVLVCFVFWVFLNDKKTVYLSLQSVHIHPVLISGGQFRRVPPPRRLRLHRHHHVVPLSGQLQVKLHFPPPYVRVVHDDRRHTPVTRILGPVLASLVSFAEEGGVESVLAVPEEVVIRGADGVGTERVGDGFDDGALPGSGQAPHDEQHL